MAQFLFQKFVFQWNCILDTFCECYLMVYNNIHYISSLNIICNVSNYAHNKRGKNVLRVPQHFPKMKWITFGTNCSKLFLTKQNRTTFDGKMTKSEYLTSKFNLISHYIQIFFGKGKRKEKKVLRPKHWPKWMIKQLVLWCRKL